MILWRLYMREQEAQIEQSRAEALAEGRTENHQLWEAWNNRRIEAEKKKIPFDEPPPLPPEDAPK